MVSNPRARGLVKAGIKWAKQVSCFLHCSSSMEHLCSRRAPSGFECCYDLQRCFMPPYSCRTVQRKAEAHSVGDRQPGLTSHMPRVPAGQK